MRYSKLLIISIPVLLAGCLDIFEDDSDNFYSAPRVNAPAPSQAPSQAPSGKPGMPSGSDTPTATSCGCPDSGSRTQQGPKPIPSEALASSSASAASSSEWRPLEGHLVRAGDLVMELQRSNGNVRPSHAAMSKHIQSNMGLTASQAELVLEEMGL